MAEHEASKSSSGDKILREIADRERQLQEELARVHQEAAQRFEDAQREAEALRATASAQAQGVIAASATDAAAEAETITAEALARARTDAEAIQKRAQERMSAAVALVVREVLGESA